MKPLSLLLAVVAVFLFALPAHALYEGGKPQQKKAEFASDRILVKFNSDATPTTIGTTNKKHGVSVKKVIPRIDVYVLRIPAGIPVEEMVKRYRGEALVEYAEPDFIASITVTPNDPRFVDQWGLNNSNDSDIDAPQAWEIKRGTPYFKIAVVDTGINLNHEDLRTMLVPGYNAINPAKNPNDDNGHGSHVAGIASAATDNDRGIAGVSWGCGLMPIKVLNAAGSGTYSDVSEGIMWAADHGANVINLSLGGSADSQTMKEAVDYAWSKGVLLACAAGNSGDNSPLYPAHYTNCLAVAATDSNDRKPSWSSYGTWVDVAAPGVSILSAYKGKPNIYKYLSGTSMATPHVAGLAGLVFSSGVTDGNGNQRVNDEVRSIIENSCDSINGTGTYWAKGRINACKALGGTNCPYTGPAQ